jgi:hypothetical protein
MLLITVLVGGGLSAARQQGDNLHPAVGTWSVESDLGDAEYTPRLMILAADGSALFVSGRQTMGMGVWQPVGDTSAMLTFAVTTDGPAYILIRTTIALAADGTSFTGTFTLEAVFDPAGGGTSGELGPGSLAGTRISAEAPGTPAASFEEMFPQPESTPIATPAN